MLFVFAVFLLTPPPNVAVSAFTRAHEYGAQALCLALGKDGGGGEDGTAICYESLSVRHPSKSVRPIAAFTCQGHSADVSGGGGGGGETHKDHYPTNKAMITSIFI